MQCQSCDYTGFSKRKYKTYKPPPSSVPVRNLRRAYADNSGTSASASVAEKSVASTGSLDGYGWALSWWFAGFVCPAGWYNYWLGATLLLLVLTQNYMRYWVVSFLFFYLLKFILL